MFRIEEEFETIRIIIRNRAGIARFGDGEFRIAIGGACSCQEGNPVLARKLRDVLDSKMPNLLIGIPRAYNRADLWRYDARKAGAWINFMNRQKYVELLQKNKQYYSAFISRPDSAPHIDCDLYWDLVKKIWENRHVVVVTGHSSKFKENKTLFSNAKKFEYRNDSWIPSRNAWAVHDQLIEMISKYKKDVVLILALGPEATVLAHECAKRGYQVIDLGHFDMFYRRRFMQKGDLITKYQLQQNVVLHNAPKGYGASSGKKWGATILYLARFFKAFQILDYGCGSGTLREVMEKSLIKREFVLTEYDLAIKGKNKLPDHPFDFVICTDVLEHIEPDKLDNVLDHLNFLVGKVGFFVINKKEANKILPDGRNAHLIQKSSQWWVKKIIEKRKWMSVETFPVINRDKDVAIIVRKL